MIVQRVSARAKPGHRDELVDLLKVERGRRVDPEGMRILIRAIGPAYNTVVYELTNKNMAENEQRWQEWASRPDLAEFWQRWLQVVDDWTDEVWEIVE
jgi:hypothetical protein